MARGAKSAYWAAQRKFDKAWDAADKTGPGRGISTAHRMSAVVERWGHLKAAREDLVRVAGVR